VATARELLEQADAMMRKNRGGSDGDIPILTDAVTTATSEFGVPTADIPVLDERVENMVVVSPPRNDPPEAAASVFEGDPSDWLVMDTIDPALQSVTGNAPDTLAVVPPVTRKTTEPAPEPAPVEIDILTPATHKAAGSASTPPPARSHVAEPILPSVADDYLLLAAAEYSQPSATSPPAPIVAEAQDSNPTTASEERWQAIAEQISMQVLQRIDLFTDTGLKEQLARHLQPIVARASAELVGEINDQVGKLVRSYVAEAIEREIAQWRSEHR
jgi:hypothetical protein